MEGDGDSIMSDEVAEDGARATEGAIEDLSASSSGLLAAPLPPHAPLCMFGARLAFTYFLSDTTPDPDVLNAQSSDPTASADSQLAKDCFFFTTDSALVYLSFYQDWGPLNVSMFYRFSLHLHGLIEDAALQSKKVVLYSSQEHDKKANAALLITLYAMVVLRWQPAEALHPISQLELRPFRDAGYARADFGLTIQDIIFGVKKAIEARLLKLDEFDVREYETFEKVENGDWNVRRVSESMRAVTDDAA